MWQQFWHDMARTLGPVYLCLAISYLVSRVIFRRPKSQQNYETYVLSDGGPNSVTVTLDARLSEAERVRILSKYKRVLASYAPTFPRSSARDISPTKGTS